jgi:hypothetical protein
MIPLELGRQERGIRSRDKRFFIRFIKVQALRVVRKWLPLGSVVTVPEVHFFDKAPHVMMDRCRSRPLCKMAGHPRIWRRRLVVRLVDSLPGCTSGDVETKAVRGNEWGKWLSAQVYYGIPEESAAGYMQEL